jgi:hypothetical protein
MDKNAEMIFFEDPHCGREPLGDFGVLYLLRCDINRCFEAEKKILWPGAMAILAGIDLLGKFLAGDDQGPVGDRFRAFVIKYFAPIASAEVEAIYQLRNSLLHSFGLYSKDRKGNVYRFQLVPDACGSLIDQIGTGLFRVDLARLYMSFESAINRYHCDLSADPGLQSKFMAMFPMYGAIPISS